MPLDVLGRTRATLSGSAGQVTRERFLIFKSARDGDWQLQFSVMNEEYLVSTGHHPVLNTSLPFVHTARRSYRLSGPVRLWDRDGGSVSLAPLWELSRTLSFRGRRSRNKVSVGEPAEGSFWKKLCMLGSVASRSFRRARLCGRRVHIWNNAFTSYKIDSGFKPWHTTRSGGCLGSHIDEERSKTRYVLRFAELVSHRIFERMLRSWEIPRARLFECPFWRINSCFLICLARWHSHARTSVCVCVCSSC